MEFALLNCAYYHDAAFSTVAVACPWQAHFYTHFLDWPAHIGRRAYADGLPPTLAASVGFDVHVQVCRTQELSITATSRH